MKYDELYKKYLTLLEENKLLKSKINEMEVKVSSPEPEESINPLQKVLFNEPEIKKIDFQTEDNLFGNISSVEEVVCKNSSKEDKILLFMSLFKGRSDVYAKRWQNKKGQSGYSPVCFNEWVPGVCNKPKIKCSKCNQKSYSPLNQDVIEQHLLGEIVIGIYPLSVGETCNFLVIDFDKEGWEKDISVVRETCTQFGIPVAVERSRSGNGGHVWFFFNDEISATLARKFGTSLLTYSMGKRHKISFKSYDRLFPNQDTMPKGGFGNLIALPLQKVARKNGNTLFVDENFEPYPDQWKYLSEIQRLTEKELVSFTTKHGKENVLGVLKNYDENTDKPWIKRTFQLQNKDFPSKVLGNHFFKYSCGVVACKSYKDS